MTEGSVEKNICIFALPCILTKIFQNLYSLIDSVMLGRAVGVTSLAAAGAAAPVISLANDTLLVFADVLGFAAVPVTDAITWLMLALFLAPAYLYELRKFRKKVM